MLVCERSSMSGISALWQLLRSDSSAREDGVLHALPGRAVRLVQNCIPGDMLLPAQRLKK